MWTEKQTDPEPTDSTADNMFSAEIPFFEYGHRVMYTTRKLLADSTTRKNLIVLASGSILAFVIAAITGLFSKIEEWGLRNNLSEYHLEEFATLTVVLAFAATIFLIRRYREMREETIEGIVPGTGNSIPERRTALPYRELENIFHQVETAKKEWERSLDSIRDMVILSDLDGTIHRCNRAFKEFIGLPYEQIVRENIAGLLMKFGIELKGLDLKSLNARFHIAGKWFGVRSYPYTDFETANIARVVIIMVDVSASKSPEEKVHFVWGRTSTPGKMTEKQPP